MKELIIKGTFIDAPVIGELRIRSGYLFVKNGIIEKFTSDVGDERDVIDYSDYLIIPGMVDLHLHAPQYSYAGTAMDVTLLDWLSKYTYPEESRYENIEYARKGYSNFVKDLKNSTTTRASIFATIHTDATLELMRQLENEKIIAYVGKLNMDRNCPDFYKEKTIEEGIGETRRWIESSSSFKRVKPMITPRFTPSVTDEYMRELGKLVEKYDLPVQSHLNENRAEIEWVRNLCPDSKNYSDTYDKFGMFGGKHKTIMAHSIYSTDIENELMKKNGVMIAHCPTSNENVIAGIAPAAYYLRNGFEIGLGSDVAGGHTLNLLEVMAASVQVSKIRTLFPLNTEKPLSISEAFYMATRGGGRFFGNVGLFEEGFEFDMVVIDDIDEENPMKFNHQERLEKASYSGKPKIVSKYIFGERII